jgi:L-asparagine transporter-like permease
MFNKMSPAVKATVLLLFVNILAIVVAIGVFFYPISTAIACLMLVWTMIYKIEKNKHDRQNRKEVSN